MEGSRYGTPRGTLQLEESRRSFRRQVEQLQDIDDKAMRTVRTAVLVIGFVVTATGITLRDGTVGFGSAVFTGLGVFFLTITVVSGIGTYSITEYKNRLTDAERARIEDRASVTPERTAELVRMYYSWMDALDEQLSEQVAYLTVTLFALVLGVSSLLIAATLVVVTNASFFEGLLKPVRVVVGMGTALSILSAMLLATRLSIKKLNTRT